MNKLNRIQTGGFPLKAQRLQEAEDAYTIFNSFGDLAGDKAIISGCTVAGSNTTDGYVYLNGELFEFRGGQTQSSVKIIEEPLVRAFQNGENKEIYYVRYVTFASGTGSIPWSEFVRVTNLQTIAASMQSLTTKVTELEKKNAIFQAGGGMVFWNRPAAEIPDGWQEVVNWRGRIPVGHKASDPDFNTLGNQGGSKTKTLTINEMPSHNHSFATSAGDSTGGGTIVTGNPNEQGGTYTMQNKGNGQSFSIMNPYRVVMFIEYVG